MRKTRMWLATTALFASLAAAHSPLAAERLDQRAADLYDRGVHLIQGARYEEGARLIWAALDRGAFEPNEGQGSETRFLVRRYDPYYWLGVARMETGFPTEALRLFEISETIVPRGSSVPVITRWKREYGDLKLRKEKLLREIGSDR
jgi:hypothetical protein